MDRWVLLNDRFVPGQEAVLPVTDLAIQRGYGVFDFFRTVNGLPRFLAWHLDRFFHSAAGMHLPLPLSRPRLEARLQELLQRNGLPDSGVRITLTGGDSPSGYRIGRPNLVVRQQLLSPPFVKGSYKLATYPYQRTLPSFKTIDYAMAIWLQPWLREQGADDVLYCDGDQVRECPRANLFLFSNGELVTPSAGVLHGITRRAILAAAAPVFRVRERPVTMRELPDAEEIFVSSTTLGLRPVTHLNGRLVGAGKTGVQTQRLQECFHAYVQEEPHRPPFR